MKYLYQNGARVFKFVDDSFIENERDDKWIINFSEQVKKVCPNALFRISVRTDQITHTKIKHLKEAGLFAVSCGIENGSYTALKRIAKSSNIEINQKALNIFSKYNIYVQAGYIMFDVETTMKELWDNLEFLKKNMQIIMKGIFTEMYAAEGIPYSKKLLQTGKVIEKKYGNYIYRITDTKVRKVYTYLKRWHMLLAEFYDKLIDPISAPKALSLEEYALFYTFIKMILNTLKKF